MYGGANCEEVSPLVQKQKIKKIQNKNFNLYFCIVMEGVGAEYRLVFIYMEFGFKKITKQFFGKSKNDIKEISFL